MLTMLSPSIWATSVGLATRNPDQALERLSPGAQSVDWWDVHIYGTSQGDFGMLLSGTSGEPATGTPFPACYGYELASILAGPDAHLPALNYSSPTVAAFSSQDGSAQSVMLINTPGQRRNRFAAHRGPGAD